MTSDIQIKRLVGPYYRINNTGRSESRVYKFFQKHNRHFDIVQEMGRAYRCLPSARIEKFKAYAEAQGFTVEMGA